MTISPIETFDFDVALSFAGEDRAYVQQVAELLRERSVRIFYDEYMASELWGNDLYVVLDEVFRKRARFTVAFISASYVSKPWTTHERQSAQARSMSQDRPYLLPVKLDSSELPGLRPTVGYLDARRLSPSQLVEHIQQKLLVVPGESIAEPVLRCPRNMQQERELLARRPSGWEYMLYAGVLWQRREALEPKWRDYELGFGPRTGKHFDASGALRFMQETMNDLASCGPNMLKMIDPKAQERAFGRPGEAGDPVLIDHLATRLVWGYEQMLDSASELRGVGVPDEIAPVLEAAAELILRPLQDIRSFIDQAVAEADRIPERLSEGVPVNIDIMLNLTVDDRAALNLDKEMKRAKRRLRI